MEHHVCFKLTLLKYLMVDVVTNHFGYNGDAGSINYNTMNPFNAQGDFHPVCWVTDQNNQTEVELVSASRRLDLCTVNKC